MILPFLFLGILGAVIGSFVAAYSFRAPRNLSIKAGRSFCDNCKKEIKWFDNIPIVSYLVLGGKCRFCDKKISPRYPIIESTFLIGFIGIFLSHKQILTTLTLAVNPFNIIFLFIIFSVLAAIFIIDLEHQIIPDELNYLLIILGLLMLFNASNDSFFVKLFAGFLFSLLLLLINLVTKGRGMGLGDVKFAVFPGMLLGLVLGTIWLFLSFMLGAVIGVILILVGKASFGRHIAFGPFLIISLVIVSLFGNIIKGMLF